MRLKKEIFACHTKGCEGAGVLTPSSWGNPGVGGGCWGINTLFMGKPFITF